jgi:pimeloyl-ACP methyl ester carboxylesterase
MVPIRACNSNFARQCNALSNSSSSPEFRRSVFEIQFGHGLLAPDADETSQSQQAKFPVTDVFKYVEVADGRAWMLPKGVECFAGDLSEEEQKVVWATHYAPAADLFSRNAPAVAWKSKASWYIVANNDRTVHPDLERFVAKRMNATTHAVDSSHVPMLSHPGFVIDVIRAAAKAVHGVSAVA